MIPTLIGYFAKRPWNPAEDQRLLLRQIEELCKVGHMHAGAPPRWIGLTGNTARIGPALDLPSLAHAFLSKSSANASEPRKP